ncbi:aspartate/glutamate racemase family protein [Bradyrhizobium sp. sBnM-33]|uniref:maleate cis-trans isomerase family protein n=1 Tax=Bradyrhizobium sp. sBnM-33 TaxID=2831780 RepID=UPI001BCD21BF|nr:aspartate/glutamate racemase family protein [Bradyrhizobium sp. sBnM-33]WOH52456.1 aspartate/glutamate racemase family protein [Bradyrhizobium sp. sBnM-33]
MEEQNSTRIFEGLTSPSKVVARIGLILLSTDEVGGDAFVSIMPKDRVSVFTTRTAYDHSGGGFSLATSFADVADTLPPAGRFDVLAFSCTSGTVALGMKSLLSQLAKARPGVNYTSPAVAGVAALRQFKAQRIALLTPYEPRVHRSFLPFFRENGFEITADGTFAKSTDAEIGELRRESIFSAAKALMRHTAPDALFISCTATPVVPYIDSLEREIGVPVVSSSQAMAWDALRLAGFRDPIAGFGRLLASPR